MPRARRCVPFWTPLLQCPGGAGDSCASHGRPMGGFDVPTSGRLGVREIVLDTETTGLDPLAGHRLAEIGCIELVNGMPSGQHFHRYVNPERDMPAEAFAVHGLSAEFLNGKPRFVEIVDELLVFLGDAPLVAHNAAFDLG